MSEFNVMTFTGTHPGLRDEIFWELWENNRQVHHGLCVRWLDGDEEEARDVLGSVMIKAYETKETAPATSHMFSAWVIRQMRESCIQYVRSRQGPHTLTKQDESGLLNDSLSQVGNPENEILRREQMDQLSAAVASLPLRIRTPMMMRCIQEKRYSEIAHEIRVTDAHARKLVQQGRDKIRQDLLTPGSAGSFDKTETEPWLLELLGENRCVSEFASAPQYAFPVQMKKADGTQREEVVFVQERMGRLDQKRISLERYVKRFSSGWKKRHELAEVHLLYGNEEEALACLQLVLRRQAHRVDLRLELAHRMDTAGKSTEAALLLSAGLVYAGRPATRNHLMAWQAFYAGEIAEGINLMKQAVVTEPGERNHLISLGKMLRRSGRSFEAWEASRDALCLDPKDTEALYLALATLRESGATTLLRGLEDHISAEVTDPLLLTDISLRQRLRTVTPDTDFDQIRKDLRHYAQLTRQGCAWAEAKARYFWQRGRVSGCLSFVRQYAAEHATCFEAQVLLLHWLVRAGKNTAAVSAANQLLEKFPQVMKSVTEALKVFAITNTVSPRAESLAGQYPSHPAVLLAVARYHLSIGHPLKTLDTLDRLTLLYPGQAEGGYLKASAEYILGRLEEAGESIRSCWNSPELEWSPFLASAAALLMGRIREKESGEEAATEWREMAGKIAGGEEKNHPALSYHFRALALAAQGDYMGAAHWKQKSLQAGIWSPEK